MRLVSLTVAGSLLFIGSALAGAAGQAVDVKVSSPLSDVGEFKYPPIRLALAEAPLTPPLLNTKDELIQASQILESALHNSGAIYHDTALDNYLREILPVDELGEKAKGFEFRIYVVRDPTVNAMTTPSGSIYINSGLLAALESTDQLRLVLAHEAHHLIDQDIVYQYKKIKDEVGAIRFLQLIATPAVAVAIGESDSNSGRTIANVYSAANIAVSISYQMAVLGYGRENENECDRFAFQIFSRYHYDLREAKRVFQLFEDEHARYGKGFSSHLFSDHETGKQRAERTEKFMKEVGYQPSPDLKPSNDPRYPEITHEIRIENARLNLKVRRPWHAREDLEELAKLYPSDARIPCLLGQVYSLISADIKPLKDELSYDEWKKLGIKDEKKQLALWQQKAADFFKKSIALDSKYADPHKELGLFSESDGKDSEAIIHFEKYMELNPTGKDVRYIKSRIQKAAERIRDAEEKASQLKAKGKKNDFSK